MLVAGGSGDRFGGPKQLRQLGDRRVLDHGIEAARISCSGVVVVLPDQLVDEVSPTVSSAVVAGGASRSASVRAGLAAVPRDADIIVVHDAARPLATPALFARVVQAVADGAEAVVPAVAVTDTIREVDGGVVNRDRLLAVQTPQAFSAAALRAAHDSGLDATDDASLIEADGGKVVVVTGEPTNLKITQPHDLDVAAVLLGAR